MNQSKIKMQSEGNGVSAEKSFRMKQNDRFLSRVMAKEGCVANCSSRVLYYGEAAVGVPFMWESQPGTPKHPLMSDQTSLPPLTPPPSYYSNPNSANNTNPSNSKLRRMFSTILPSKPHVSPSSSSPSSSSFSSSSSSSSWSLVYPSPSLISMTHKDHGEVCLSRTSRSPNSSFPLKRRGRGSNGFRGLGCYPFRNMKNAILNIILD